MSGTTPSSSLTMTQASQYIDGKKSLYQALQRKGFFLPSLSSSLVTISYLEAIRARKVWCLKNDDFHLKACLTPPLKAFILKRLHELAIEKHLNLGITAVHFPDKAWAVQVLGVLEPANEIFHPDFVLAAKDPVKEDLVVDNSDCFFDGLPALPNKRRMKRSRLFATEKLVQKINRLKESKRKIDLRIGIEHEAYEGRQRQGRKVLVEQDALEKLQRENDALKNRLRHGPAIAQSTRSANKKDRVCSLEEEKLNVPMSDPE